MGTRHLIIVYYKGAYVLAQYGQWDGYPSVQGLTVLQFVSNPENITKLKATFDNNLLYVPTPDELNAFWKRVEVLQKQLDTRRESLWNSKVEEDVEECVRLLGTEGHAINLLTPSLSRDTGAKILSLIANATEPVPIRRGLDFIVNFGCEWADCLDLDEGVLEVYKGTRYKSARNRSTRFDFLDVVEKGSKAPNMIARYQLDALPSEAELEALERCDDSDEEDVNSVLENGEEEKDEKDGGVKLDT